MRRFIKLLIFAVEKITECSVKPFGAELQKGLILSTPLNVSRCVYKCNGTVYKLCNKKMIYPDHEGQHISLGISYLKLEVVKLSEDGCFYMLCYDFHLKTISQL